MHDILVAAAPQTPVAEQPSEYVERKGLGHPDSICDAVMESISVALCGAYVEAAGRVLHHNLDKALLVAGRTSPALGGGRVDQPMRMVFGDRATSEYPGGSIPVAQIAETTAKHWLAENLRFVEPDQHFIFQNEIKPGSAELVDIFARDQLVAGDTSAAVGYAPMTETERLVLAAEHWLNSAAFKKRFPEAGEDVKVMGVRRGHRLHMTIALAFVDRFVASEQDYFERKEAVAHHLQGHLDAELTQLDGVEIHLNTLDTRGRGLGGMYLTVLGTSAENGDGGQVGRGNPVSGVISLNRPTSNEAAAGKNAVSHVGKIYNLLSHQIADRIYTSLDAVEEVYVWLCSQIGHPVHQPWFTSTNVVLAPDAVLSDVEAPIKKLIQAELQNIPQFSERIARGELAIC